MITPVAIALVLHDGCYLVGRRGPNGPLAGFCEFPGGKCDPGESPADCAVRECFEETGLRIEVIRLRREILHTYPYASVQLFFFDCRIAPNASVTLANNGFEWVRREELAALDFPEPNQTLLEELAAD